MARAKTNGAFNGNGRSKSLKVLTPTSPGKNGKSKPILITGGAGFVGSNLAHRLLSAGHRVRLLDNLSRAGVERNLRWLMETHGDLVDIEVPDVRNLAIIKKAVRDASQVFHFAAQVAVTTSLVDPLDDFEVNARGTLNVLEAVRTAPQSPPIFFTSTNKVYGGLHDVRFTETNGRHTPASARLAARGIDERRPLDFHSPYGCSKGTADQYLRDYARSYGIKSVVFRMSCIYGPHQFGNEDQGWVAHFVHAVQGGQPITIYGDGGQVRDLLDVRDLCRLYSLALAGIDHCAGEIFNIGGGPSNARSVIEVLTAIEQRLETDAHYGFSRWRPGDQVYYVSDLARVGQRLGWRPEVGFEAGLEHLIAWVRNEKTGVATALSPG